MHSLTRLSDLADRLSERVGKAISWMCLAMIGVLIYEVSARYLFNSPTEWAHESTTMLYGTFCILAGAYTHRHHGHVRSEVIYNLFNRRGRAALDIITGLIGLLVFGIFLVIASHYAWDSWVMKEVSSKSTWAPPVYPFKAMLPLAILLMMIQSAAHLLRDVITLLQGRPHPAPRAESACDPSETPAPSV